LLISDNPLDIDDVAAMDPHEAALVESRLHVADRQRTKQLVVAVEDVRVVRVGVDRDHLIDRDKMGTTVPLDREVDRNTARRTAGTPKRSEGPSAQFRSITPIANGGVHLLWCHCYGRRISFSNLRRSIRNEREQENSRHTESNDGHHNSQQISRKR